MQPLTGLNMRSIEVALCFSCQGLWFDPQENLLLLPAAVVDLFKLLHKQSNATRQPLAETLNCPTCTEELSHGFDVVRSGRYITYRCARGHGRFSTFSSFMIEKGFVRQLSGFEIADFAKLAEIIHCRSCGAPVDLRKDHACPNCRSAFSLLDPQATDRALQGYVGAANSTVPSTPLSADRAMELADALINIERDWKRILSR